MPGQFSPLPPQPGYGSTPFSEREAYRGQAAYEADVRRRWQARGRRVATTERPPPKEKPRRVYPYDIFSDKQGWMRYYADGSYRVYHKKLGWVRISRNGSYRRVAAPSKRDRGSLVGGLPPKKRRGLFDLFRRTRTR